MINDHLQYIKDDYDTWEEIATKRRRIHAHGTGYLRDYKVYFVLVDALGKKLRSIGDSNRFLQVRLYWRFHCNSVADDHRSSATELQWNLQYNQCTYYY
jgi:hypothetical protein